MSVICSSCFKQCDELDDDIHYMGDGEHLCLACIIGNDESPGYDEDFVPDKCTGCDVSAEETELAIIDLSIVGSFFCADGTGALCGKCLTKSMPFLSMFMKGDALLNKEKGCYGDNYDENF